MLLLGSSLSSANMLWHWGSSPAETLTLYNNNNTVHRKQLKVVSLHQRFDLGLQHAVSTVLEPLPPGTSANLPPEVPGKIFVRERHAQPR